MRFSLLFLALMLLVLPASAEPYVFLDAFGTDQYHIFPNYAELLEKEANDWAAPHIQHPVAAYYGVDPGDTIYMLDNQRYDTFFVAADDTITSVKLWYLVDPSVKGVTEIPITVYSGETAYRYVYQINVTNPSGFLWHYFDCTMSLYDASDMVNPILTTDHINVVNDQFVFEVTPHTLDIVNAGVHEYLSFDHGPITSVYAKMPYTAYEMEAAESRRHSHITITVADSDVSNRGFDNQFLSMLYPVIKFVMGDNELSAYYILKLFEVAIDAINLLLSIAFKSFWIFLLLEETVALVAMCFQGSFGKAIVVYFKVKYYFLYPFIAIVRFFIYVFIEVAKGLINLIPF